MHSQNVELVEWNQQNRREIYNLWKESIDYILKIHDMSKHLPPNIKLGVDVRLRLEAFGICENIAKGANALEKKDLLTNLESAVKSIQAALSFAYIARQWRYLREDVFQQLYLDGKVISKRISAFGLDVQLAQI